MVYPLPVSGLGGFPCFGFGEIPGLEKDRKTAFYRAFRAF